MANTVFFQNIKRDDIQITWKDIFSEYKEKHTKRDLEYALLAGSSLDTATEENMLAKWRKPWIFYPALKGGLILIGLFYLVFFLSISSAVMTNTVFYMTVLIPPLIPPLILMILFWEMNIPRNVSIYQMLGMFLIGGLFSFFLTGIFMWTIPSELHPAFAALREEPAKLAVVVLFLMLLQKNRKLYGLTGLVVGAAVGAGFGAFESADYALNSAMDAGIVGFIVNQILRGIFALGGHTLFCAPYSAALAINTKDGKLSKNSFTNKTFISTFFISMLLHFIWNGGLPILQYILFGDVLIPLNSFVLYIAIIILLWIQTLKIIRLCLRQVVDLGQYKPGSSSEYDSANRYFTVASRNYHAVTSLTEQIRPQSLVIERINDEQHRKWKFDGNNEVIVGRGSDCLVQFPKQARGISRRHLSFQIVDNNWTVRDLGSMNGSFVSGGVRLSPFTDWKLEDGDIIWLGEKENSLIVHL